MRTLLGQNYGSLTTSEDGLRTEPSGLGVTTCIVLVDDGRIIYVQKDLVDQRRFTMHVLLEWRREPTDMNIVHRPCIRCARMSFDLQPTSHRGFLVSAPKNRAEDGICGK